MKITAFLHSFVNGLRDVNKGEQYHLLNILYASESNPPGKRSFLPVQQLTEEVVYLFHENRNISKPLITHFIPKLPPTVEV